MQPVVARVLHEAAAHPAAAIAESGGPVVGGEEKQPGIFNCPGREHEDLGAGKHRRAGLGPDAGLGHPSSGFVGDQLADGAVMAEIDSRCRSDLGEAVREDPDGPELVDPICQ